MSLFRAQKVMPLLANVYEKMLADTTPMEPEFMKALYSNRSALYTTFEDDDPPA